MDQIGVVLRDPSGVLCKEIRHSLDASSGCYLASPPEPIMGMMAVDVTSAPKRDYYFRLAITACDSHVIQDTCELRGADLQGSRGDQLFSREHFLRRFDEWWAALGKELKEKLSNQT